MHDPEDFDDDDFDDFFGDAVDVKPLDKYAFIHFGLNMVIGVTRTFLESMVNLGNAVHGSEVYHHMKKDFEDEARLQIDMITGGATEE